MLSILIPVYNYNVTRFVTELKRQADALQIPYEIICLDDCSDEQFKPWNKVLGELENVHYSELRQKAGRAKIRNKLADMAKYKNLLFLDCDQQAENPYFIKNYIDKFGKAPVIVGGRTYSKTAPDDATYLRWFYGVNREVIPAGKRSQNPYKSFLSCNFLIGKDLFQKIGFDENLSEYGHEDTLFGIELKTRKTPILHIENPVVHEGLEDAETFLDKSRQALKNLSKLYLQDNKDLKQNVKILHWFEKAKKWQLRFPLWLVFKFSEKMLEQNLLSKSPSLKVFDFYKLGYFIGLMSKIER